MIIGISIRQNGNGSVILLPYSIAHARVPPSARAQRRDSPPCVSSIPAKPESGTKSLQKWDFWPTFPYHNCSMCVIRYACIALRNTLLLPCTYVVLTF